MASTNELLVALEGLESGSCATEAERSRVRDALYKALREIQTPWDVAWEHSWANPAVSACINTFTHMGLFTKWAEAGHQPMTCAELAELTGADAALLRRMLRCLAGQHLIAKTAEDTYRPTPWSRSFATQPEFADVYGDFHGEMMRPVCSALPKFLEETGYKNPDTVERCCFECWQGEDIKWFEWLAQNQEYSSAFSRAMKMHSKYNQATWTEVYPTESIIAAGKQKPDRKLVVDIGGSKGHDIVKFLSKHREDCPPGSLVLQDLPDTLRGVDLGTGAVELQPHDFFTPQPVRGARAYFMHIVLHDWPDDKAAQILGNVAAAMEKGYSRLLLQESLMADEKPLARVTALDIIMMAAFSSAERSETEWNALLASAGLKVVNIWRHSDKVETVIEAELA